MNGNKTEIDLLLLDVLRGYSKIYFKGECYYFRQFRVYDDLKLSEYELEAFNSALKNGIKKESDLLKVAEDKGFWSKKDEESIKNLKWMISKSETAAGKIVDLNMRLPFEKRIGDQKKELSELENRRGGIINHSAEKLAARKRTSKTLMENIFLDESMTQLIDEDDLFYVSDAINHKVDKLCSLNNILRMAYNPAFFDYFTVCYRDPMSLIKKDIFSVTQWQKNLIFYASTLLNKLKSLSMPDEVREDAVSLYNFKEKDESQDSDNKVTHGVSDLRAKMAKNEGKLTAEDF
jgi:hypothetical protein